MSECKPCPFCGSNDVDPEGWMGGEPCVSGPACMECDASARTVEVWNAAHQRLLDAFNDGFRKGRVAVATDRETPFPSEKIITESTPT